MKSRELSDLVQKLRDFAAERDWDQFHSPKSLACALSVEAGEILEHFQWMKDSESAALPEETRSQVSLELADVFLYLLRLADKLDVDLVDAAKQKLEINARKYPVDLAKDSSKKYREL